MYTMIRTQGQDVREIGLSPRIKNEEQARKVVAKWNKRQEGQATFTLKQS